MEQLCSEMVFKAGKASEVKADIGVVETRL